MEECRLLQGVYALVAQALLVGIVMLSLAFKRYRERPQRPLLVWAMDVSKQVVSSGAAHVGGLAFSILAHWQTRSQGTSECSWYFVIYTMDTTLGVSLTLMMHEACLRAARSKLARGLPSDGHLHVENASLWDDLISCGQYGQPPSIRRWLVQLVEFTSCVVTARILCGVVVLWIKDWLAHLTASIDDAFRSHNAELLFVVMILWPLSMNIIQAWIQDHILLWQTRPSDRGPGNATDALLEQVTYEWASCGTSLCSRTNSPTSRGVSKGS